MYAVTEFFFLKNIRGESVSLKKENFDLNEFLSDMNAEVVFVEQTEEMNLYYAYSPNLKYKKIVDGRLVNVQIAIAKERVTVGSPLIFGSF